MTTATAASLGPDAEAVIDDLADVALPSLPRVLGALADLAREAQADRQSTADALLVLAGDGPNVVELIGHIVQLLGDPYSNPAIAGLPIGRTRAIQAHTGQYAAYLTAFAPGELATEAAAHIHEA